MKKILLIICLTFFISQSFSQKIKILTNHLGYEPVSYKNAVIEAYSGDKISNCTINSYSDDKIIAALNPVEVGKIDQWKNWYFWTVDFSPVQEEGTYYIECKTNRGTVYSFPFSIMKNILKRADPFRYYILFQRTTVYWTNGKSRQEDDFFGR